MSLEFHALIPREQKTHLSDFQKNRLVRMRLEAQDPIYGLDAKVIGKAKSEEDLLQLILGTKWYFPTKSDWRNKATTVYGKEGGAKKEGATPLLIMAARGHIEMVSALLEKGEFASEQMTEAAITAMPAGTGFEGTTMIYMAALYGRWEMLDLIRTQGNFTPEQWREQMNKEVKGRGQEAGFTPLFVMALNGGWRQSDGRFDDHRQQMALNSFYKAAYVKKDLSYDQEGLQEDMNAPVSFGDSGRELKAVGRTPLFAAARDGGSGAIISFKANGYKTVESWVTAITTPLCGGKDAGQAPIDAAVLRGIETKDNKKQLVVIRENQTAVLQEMLRDLNEDQCAKVLGLRGEGEEAYTLLSLLDKTVLSKVLPEAVQLKVDQQVRALQQQLQQANSFSHPDSRRSSSASSNGSGSSDGGPSSTPGSEAGSEKNSPSFLRHRHSPTSAEALSASAEAAARSGPGHFTTPVKGGVKPIDGNALAPDSKFSPDSGKKL